MKDKKKHRCLSATMENYLELIYKLQKKYGAVRVTDLARNAGCKLPSVTNALQRLAKSGYIKYENYRPVVLTEKGKRVVKKLESGQTIISLFLIKILGMDKKEAKSEACYLEHVLSKKLLQKLYGFMRFVETTNEGKLLVQNLKAYFHNSNSTREQNEEIKNSENNEKK